MAVAAAAVRRLHHARSAARHDGPPGLGEETPRFARQLVGTRVLRNPRRAEARDRRAVDPLHRLEAFEKLVADRLRVLLELLILVMGAEKVAVVHTSRASHCGGWRAGPPRAPRRAGCRASRSASRAPGPGPSPRPEPRSRDGSSPAGTARWRA